MKGFTLMEMLVVVLIAGILSTVALPLYQKAVKRSQATEALTTGKSIVESQNRALDLNPDGDVYLRSSLDIALVSGEWQNGANFEEKETEYYTNLFKYTLKQDGVRACRRDSKGPGGCLYTLTFHNRRGGQNTCSGDSYICEEMASFGFKTGS